MNIAQIASLFESVPPSRYGGTERIVSYLTEELVRRGHDVTLFASGDSITAVELVPCCDEAFRLSSKVGDPLPYQIMQLEKVRQRTVEFDVLHFHIDLMHFPLIRDLAGRTVTTLHGRLDLPDLAPFYCAFRDIPLVSISKAQRWPLPNVAWVGNVPHGVPRDLLPFQPFSGGDYLAFLGYISPEKRPDQAIEIAARSGLKLKIAANIDGADRDYWEQHVRPMIEHNAQVEFLGEINERQKAAFLGNARALLFPIDWPEPFGLVMIEAMACGTPVIAFRHGSVPEVVEHGVSGFIVNDVEQAVEAVRCVDELNRPKVRCAFERRFTVEAMARAYLEINLAFAIPARTTTSRARPSTRGCRLRHGSQREGVMQSSWMRILAVSIPHNGINVVDQQHTLEMIACLNGAGRLNATSTLARCRLLRAGREQWSGTIRADEDRWVVHDDRGDDEPIHRLYVKTLRLGDYLRLGIAGGREISFRIERIVALPHAGKPHAARSSRD